MIYGRADPGASRILGGVAQGKLSDGQIFSFSAGPDRQVGRALAESLAVITHTLPLIKHTQINYVGNLWPTLPVPQQLSTQICAAQPRSVCSGGARSWASSCFEGSTTFQQLICSWSPSCINSQFLNKCLFRLVTCCVLCVVLYLCV